jgi:hypothetical protein
MTHALRQTHSVLALQSLADDLGVKLAAGGLQIGSKGNVRRNDEVDSQIGGFGFGKGKRRITILWCLCAAYFSAVSIPDYLMQDPLEALTVFALFLLTGTFAMLLLYAPDPPEEPAAHALPTEESSAMGPELP